MYKSRFDVPVKEGDEIDVKIEAIGEKGDGIAKKDGFVIFIPGVSEGESVRIRVGKVLRKMAFGEKIGEASGEVSDDGKPDQENFDEESEDMQEDHGSGMDEPEQKKEDQKPKEASDDNQEVDESIKDSENF